MSDVLESWWGKMSVYFFQNTWQVLSFKEGWTNCRGFLSILEVALAHWVLWSDIYIRWFENPITSSSTKQEASSLVDQVKCTELYTRPRNYDSTHSAQGYLGDDSQGHDQGFWNKSSLLQQMTILLISSNPWPCHYDLVGNKHKAVGCLKTMYSPQTRSPVTLLCYSWMFLNKLHCWIEVEDTQLSQLGPKAPMSRSHISMPMTICCLCPHLRHSQGPLSEA